MRLYTLAIKLDTHDKAAVCRIYSNCSACHAAKNRWREAAADAQEARPPFSSAIHTRYPPEH